MRRPYRGQMRNFVGGVAEVARAIRVAAQQFAPPYSLSAILEVVSAAAVITGCELPDGVEEVVAVTEDGPLILYRRELSTEDRRFALAHAIAHLVYDLDGSAYVVDDDRERRADEFALELLAPSDEMERKLVYLPEDGEDRSIYMDQVDLIAAHFHVPAPQIDKRIRELNRLGNSHDERA